MPWLAPHGPGDIRDRRLPETAGPGRPTHRKPAISLGPRRKVSRPRCSTASNPGRATIRRQHGRQSEPAAQAVHRCARRASNSAVRRPPRKAGERLAARWHFVSADPDGCAAPTPHRGREMRPIHESLPRHAVRPSAYPRIVWPRPASDSSMRTRAIVSPGIRRTCPPAASSVVSISASAVLSHAVSSRPERFLNPSTATVGRVDRWVPAAAGAGRTASRPRHNPAGNETHPRDGDQQH